MIKAEKARRLSAIGLNPADNPDRMSYMILRASLKGHDKLSVDYLSDDEHNSLIEAGYKVTRNNVSSLDHRYIIDWSEDYRPDMDWIPRD